MKRVAIFAHYDKNNIIQDYVLYYLQELHKLVDNIIFVSDSNLSDKELEKIKKDTICTLAEPHGEYDFGSYKRGFNKALELGILDNCEELIFANDSCYAPLLPFEELFNRMSTQPIDFWGVTMNTHGIELQDNQIKQCMTEHIQSYFIAFKRQIFQSQIFSDFINSIKKLNSKPEIIINYEIGLSKKLTEAGYKFDVYSTISKKKSVPNAVLSNALQIIKTEKTPFLKRNIMLYKEYKYAYPLGIKNAIKKETHYNYDLIKNDQEQNSLKLNKIEHICGILKSFRRLFFRLNLKERSICLLGNWYSF